MGRMSTLLDRGDAEVKWTPGNEAEESLARRQFQDAIGHGFAAFEMTARGKGEQITEFDPELGDILLVPPMAGG